jgi:riboflavin kinase/FMN adenylyltransferase
MTTIHRLDHLPPSWGPCVVTIGVFDGVHRGHAQLIRRTVETARRLGLPAVLVTFDPHPALVVGPPRDVAALSSIPHRAGLATDLGIDAVCVLAFSHEFAQLTAAEFVDDVLADTLQAAMVVVGANFTFGHRGAGTTDTLTQLCRHRDIDTDIVGAAPPDRRHLLVDLGSYRLCVAAPGSQGGRPGRVAFELSFEKVSMRTKAHRCALGR